MKVREAIKALSFFYQDADLVINLPPSGTGYDCRAVVKLDTGFFVVDEPGDTIGCGVHHTMQTVQDDGQMLLDLASPKITPAVFLVYEKTNKHEKD
jgi:hypothetical protein